MQQLISSQSPKEQLESWFKDACKGKCGCVMIFANDGPHLSGRIAYPFEMQFVSASITLAEFYKGKKIEKEPLTVLDCTDLVMHPLENQYLWQEFCRNYFSPAIVSDC